LKFYKALVATYSKIYGFIWEAIFFISMHVHSMVS